MAQINLAFLIDAAKMTIKCSSHITFMKKQDDIKGIE